MNNKNITDVLTERVYIEFSENSYLRLAIEINPNRKYDEIAKHIKKYINSYLTDAEQKQLIREYHRYFSEDDNNANILNAAINLAAIDVKKLLDNGLKKKELVVNNQFKSNLCELQKMFSEFLDRQNNYIKDQFDDDYDYDELPF